MKYESKFPQNLEVNREKICPFLLKVYFRENERNSFEDMSKGIFPKERELNIHTWMDCNLRELTTLIKEVVICARKRNAELHYSLLYYDSSSKLQRKELGTVLSVKKSRDDFKSFSNMNFSIGDCIDVSIKTNN